MSVSHASVFPLKNRVIKLLSALRATEVTLANIFQVLRVWLTIVLLTTAGILAWGEEQANSD